MKFKNSIGLILMCLLFIMPLVMAESENFDDLLKIKIYSISDVPNFTGEGIISIEFNVEFISKEDPFNNYTFPFTLYENKSLSILEGNIFYRVLAEGTTIENIDYKKDFDKCIDEKGSLNRGYTTCNTNLAKYEGINASNYKTDLDACTLTKKEKDLEITSKNEEIEGLKEDMEETKNQRLFWGIGGIIIGIIGLLFYRGEIGKAKAKDKSEGEFNPRQSG